MLNTNHAQNTNQAQAANGIDSTPFAVQTAKSRLDELFMAYDKAKEDKSDLTAIQKSLTSELKTMTNGLDQNNYAKLAAAYLGEYSTTSAKKADGNKELARKYGFCRQNRKALFTRVFEAQYKGYSLELDKIAGLGKLIHKYAFKVVEV